MIYEIRLYTVVAGRLDVALERFEKHLPTIFERHGIRNVGRWTASAGAGGPMFVYLMTYDSLGDRETQWNAFYSDPEWWDVRARTQGDEEATERFDIFLLQSNAAWQPPQHRPEETVGGVQDLIFMEMAVGKAARASAFLSHSYIPALTAAGAQIMMVADFVAGPALPKVALMAGWADPSSRQAGMAKLAQNAELNLAVAAQRSEFGRPLFGKTDVYLLDPTPFALPHRFLGLRGEVPSPGDN